MSRHTPAPRPDLSNVYGRASRKHNHHPRPVTERGRQVARTQLEKSLMGALGRPFI